MLKAPSKSPFPTLGFSTILDFNASLVSALFDVCLPEKTSKELFTDNANGVYFLVDRDGSDLTLFEPALSRRLQSRNIDFFPVDFARFIGTKRTFVQTLVTLIFLQSRFRDRISEITRHGKDHVSRVLRLFLKNNPCVIRFLQCKSLNPDEMEELGVSSDLANADNALHFLRSCVERLNQSCPRAPLFYFKSIPWKEYYARLDTSVFRLFDMLAKSKMRLFIVLTGTIPDVEQFYNATRLVHSSLKKTVRVVALRTLTGEEVYQVVWNSLESLCERHRRAVVRPHPFTPRVVRFMIRELSRTYTSMNRFVKTFVDVWGKVVAEHREFANYDDVTSIISEQFLRPVRESLPERLRPIQRYHSDGQIAYDREKDIFRPLGFLNNFREIDIKLRYLGYAYERSIRGWKRFS